VAGIFSFTYDRPFVLFSTSHLLTLLAVVAVWVAVPLLLKGVHDEQGKRLVRWILAGIMFAQHVSWHLWRIAAHQFDVKVHLPLELCAITNFVCIVMLLTRRKTWYEVAYFWALAGAMQAIVTPDTRFAFPHFEFVQTYVHHGLLILAVLYMTIVERFRPTFRSFLKVAVITNAYLVVIFIFNMLIGSNYVFINRVPDFDTLVSVIVQVTGPWPWYVLGMEAVGAVSCLLVYSPFAIMDAVRRTSVPPTPGSAPARRS
jgi:hypothetical integral membrane protein (TIGR02206 family)